MSVLKIKDENDQWTPISTIKGETGDAAGFGTVTATVDKNVGTPTVVVTSSGENTAKNFAFQFKNLGYDDSQLQSDFADVESDFADLSGDFSNLQTGFTTLQGQFDTAVAAVTTDTEVTDIRVGADGVTDTTAGASVRRQFTNLKSDFTHFAESTSDFVKSENIYDESAGIAGHYIDQTTGNVEIGGIYTYWEYMDCSEFDTIIISRSLQNYVGNVTLRYALYDENKNFIAGGLGTDFNPVFDSEIQRFVGSIPSQGAKYIRISYDTDQVIENRLLCVGNSELYVPYVNNIVPKRTADIPHMYEGVLGKSVLSVSADTFTSGRLSLIDNNIQSPNKIVFVANVTSFNRIDIAHADIYDNGDRIVIDNTNMAYIVNGTPTSPMAHSLTIKDYIKVTIEVEAHYQGKFNITIETNGGKYTRSDLWWVGYYGGVYVDCIGSSLTACKLIFSADALNSNVWIMGDSYLSYAPIRWPYYMYEDGITDFLINAYPGAGCANILPTFENLLSYGNPKYAIWCLGMNDPDSGSLNASWQVRTGTFITECTLNNIEPILATIPNTPTQDNTYKNAFVRASGLRYIDFAKAVNAESAGATWYSGMLSDDNVHPTEEGAKALYMAFVRDFPEILSAK